MEKEKRDWEALASELRKLLEYCVPSAKEELTVYPYEHKIDKDTSIFIDPKPGHEGVSLMHYGLAAITDFCRCKRLYAWVRARTDKNGNALWRVIIG